MRFAKAMPAMIQVRVSREEKRWVMRAAREHCTRSLSARAVHM